ncbi:MULTISPECIES: glycosyltransferase family 4 protein [Ramlibacter]|uniref:Glycosyl transferase n=1 Tax=Ramlibacter pinisoli TaxID=2682844 RepID=A0A6N8ISB3_9BURK|nr:MULTISPECIES: glycosyltransferase [Ramlibacter]MBA2964826.1 glycosyl transferase [Ramlibacter sp. CGMCC 1.13660]MVQ29791.1 glycosyl transferase [Ramlibacter pinisoli]
MLLILVLCGVVSSLLCAFLVRSGRRIGRQYRHDMPQRFHAGHVPRLGGVAIMAATAVGWTWLVVANRYLGVPNGIQLAPHAALAWGAVALVATATGTAEDLSHVLRARWRMLFTGLAAILAVWLLGLQVTRLALPWIDGLWQMTPWPGILLALVAIAGLPHAFNLIDGYNGLAATVAIICCLALAYVALQVGDREIAGLVLATAGATAGFLVWNYPRGLIFAGDGGAYLWGVVIAMASVLLVQRHAQVSPWFSMLLLAYPVLELTFSAYRKAARGQSPGMADALHFHQLIYRRVVREVFHDDEARRMLMRNNRTSPYLWGFSAFTVAPAALFWDNTPVLIGVLVTFVAFYVWAYIAIVRFKVPRWLRRGLRP